MSGSREQSAQRLFGVKSEDGAKYEQNTDRVRPQI